MKLVIFILTVFVFSVTGKAQTINYSGKDVSLKEIFSTLKEQTGVVFFYDAELLNNTKSISVDWTNLGVETALNEICEGLSFTWVAEDQTITFIKDPVAPTDLAILALQQIPVRVEGVLTDDQGAPISGVTVVAKGTKNETASNEAGEFSIDVDPNDLLVFSSLNYITKEMKVESLEMHVSMQLYSKPLEAMLVRR